MLTPQEQSDHIEIAQVLERYGRALDDKDYDLLDSAMSLLVIPRMTSLSRCVTTATD